MTKARPPALGQDRLEDLLRQMPLARAPDGLWEGIRADLERPEPARVVPIYRRRVRSPVVIAAAAMAAVIGGSYLGLIAKYAAPARWQVAPTAGRPSVAGTSLTEAGHLAAGEWLTTDSLSSAELAVGRIGWAGVGPNSRVRIDPSGRTEHRLTLARGSIDAVINAPPRLFFVETPSALATDLGCAYTLEVDSTGASRIHVTAGWVELKQGNGVSLVPAGLIAEVEVGGAPGTPYPDGLAPDAREALRRLDRGTAGPGDLDLVLDGLHTPTDFVTLRQQSAITLWHLLQRQEGDGRHRVYDRLAGLSPPPAGVSREGILALDRRMLERWRRDLSPMWAEEPQPLVTRVVRRFWEWVM